MAAGRATAHGKRLLVRKNLYAPQEIIKEINKVKHMNVIFIDYEDRNRASFEAWKYFLDKHVNNMQPSFTANFVV